MFIKHFLSPKNALSVIDMVMDKIGLVCFHSNGKVIFFKVIKPKLERNAW